MVSHPSSAAPDAALFEIVTYYSPFFTRGQSQIANPPRNALRDDLGWSGRGFWGRMVHGYSGIGRPVEQNGNTVEHSK